MVSTPLPWVILILLGLWVIRETAIGGHGRVPWILLILLVVWSVHRFFLHRSLRRRLKDRFREDNDELEIPPAPVHALQAGTPISPTFKALTH